MRRTFTLLLATLLLAVGPAWAADLSLDSAKKNGLVGEQADGYLGPVSTNPSAEVKGLVADINTRRRAEYQRIAKANQITLKDVEKLAGQKAIQRTARGNFVRQGDGNWRRK